MSSDEKVKSSEPLGASKRYRVKSPRTLNRMTNWTPIEDTPTEEEENLENSPTSEVIQETQFKQPQHINKKEQENQELKSEINLLKKQVEKEIERNQKQTDLIGKLRGELLTLKKQSGENSKSISEYNCEIENLVSIVMELSLVNAQSLDEPKKQKPSILNISRGRGSRPISYRELPSLALDEFFEEDEEEEVESRNTSPIENSPISNLNEFDQKKIDISIYKSLERKYSKIVGKSVTTNRSIKQQLIKEPSSEILDLLNPLFKVIKYNPDGGLLTRRYRLWLLDLFSRKIRNQNSRKDQKEYPMDNLFLIEKNINDPLVLKLKFLDAIHDYELIFENSQMRQTFYELTHLGRRVSFCYSPKFALEDNSFSSVILFDKKKGTAKVNLSSDLVENILIQCITWKNQDKKSFQNLLEKLDLGETDIFLMCLQSINDSNISSFFERFEPEYSILSFVISSNICLILLAKSIHLPIITNIQYDLKNTSGTNNQFGLFGSIGVSFKFNETTFCFVGAQLNEDAKNRRINIMSIMNGLKLGMNNLDISQFNHLFWLGNLNFELSCDEEDVLEYIEENNISSLLNNDSLQYDILTKRTFAGFSEGKIDFLPNSKFDKNGKYVPKVKPSYNDRIIYKTHSNLTTEVVKYESIKIDSEDLPIIGIFKCATHRLYASCFSDQTNQLVMKFSKLYLTDMKNGDIIKKPLLTVHGNFLETCSVTSTKSKQNKSGYEPTINPELDGFEIPPLYPIYNDRNFLSKQFLMISISDLSLGNSISENLIGTCVLPLTGLTGKKEAKIQFISSIQSFTQEIGNLNGSFQCKEDVKK
eukprot:gene8702-648_t